MLILSKRGGIHVRYLISPAPGLDGPPPAVQRPVAKVAEPPRPAEPQHICILPGCSESCIYTGGQTQFCGPAHFEEGRQAGLQSYPYYRFSEETARVQALGLMDFLGDLKVSESPPDHNAVIAFSCFKQALHGLLQDPPQDSAAIFALAQPTRPPIKKARSSGSDASKATTEAHMMDAWLQAAWDTNRPLTLDLFRPNIALWRDFCRQALELDRPLRSLAPY
jgi:hypothetical protein